MLNLISKANLGSKQTIIKHDCLIKDEGYDLVFTPQRQTVGYIRSKLKTRKKNTKIATLKQIIKRRFSKTTNAVSESDTTTSKELQNLKDSIDKNSPITDKNIFLTQNPHHHHQ